MTAVGFVSRADAGLRKPKSVSRNVTPARGGVAVHYGGDGAPPSTHAGCIARWKSWQDFHMNGRGWVDIAYNFGFCNHGYVFAGRGFGIRSAANGTNDGNQRFMAAVWIGGGTHTPTPEAYAALDWIVAENRRLGAGRDVRPHRYFKATGCPGTALAARAAQLHGANTPSSTPAKPAAKPPAKPAASKRRLPAFPLPKGHWFGPESRNPRNHSGFWKADRPHIRAALNALRARGWKNVPNTDRYTPAVREAFRKYQADAGFPKKEQDGLLGLKTWNDIATSPIR